MNQKYSEAYTALIAIVFACLFVLAAAPTAQAEEFLNAPECYAKDVLARYDKRFRGLDLSQTNQLCQKDQPAKHRIIEALEFINNIKFDRANGSSGDDLVTPLLPDNWGKFLSSQIDEFTFESECPATAFSYVIVGEGVHRMHLCPNVGDRETFSIVSVVSSLMHEAWHVRSPVRHVNCLAGEHVGFAGACDESAAVHGAYGVTLEVLAKIAASGSNVGFIMRDSARSQALAVALNSFNVQPKIVRGQVPVIVTTDGFLKLNAPKNFRTIRKIPAGLITARVDGDLMVFPTDGVSDAVHMSQTGNFDYQSNTPDSIEAAFANMSARDRRELKGIHYGTPLSAVLSANSLTVFCRVPGKSSGELGRASKMNSSADAMTSIVYPNGYDSDLKTITIQSAKGNWADVSCDANNKAKITAWKKASYSSVNKVMRIGGTLYAMNPQGDLFRESIVKGQSKFIGETSGKMKITDFFQRAWIRYIDGE